MESKVVYALMIMIAIGAVAWGLVSFNHLEQARSELSLLNRQIETLEMNLEIAENTIDETEEDLASAQQQLTSAQQELTSVQQELYSAELTIGSLESTIELYEDTWGFVASGIQPPSIGVDLVNYGSATNPTWTQLLNFLLNDKTDQKAYVPDVYVCRHFARDVHNNAETAGIRAAWVSIDFESGGAGHALNAFKTTDRGLVFIDCTGQVASQSSLFSYDKTVDVRLGKSYIPESLFGVGGQLRELPECCHAADVEVYW